MSLIVDTNIVIHALRGDPVLAEALDAAETVHVPVIVLAELRVGVLRGARSAKQWEGVRLLMGRRNVRPMSVDEGTVEPYAQTYDTLRQAGTPIGLNDIWIAALCLQHGLPLLTRDEDFRRIPGLRLV